MTDKQKRQKRGEKERERERAVVCTVIYLTAILFSSLSEMTA